MNTVTVKISFKPLSYFSLKKKTTKKQLLQIMSFLINQNFVVIIKSILCFLKNNSKKNPQKCRRKLWMVVHPKTASVCIFKYSSMAFKYFPSAYCCCLIGFYNARGPSGCSYSFCITDYLSMYLSIYTGTQNFEWPNNVLLEREFTFNNPFEN